MKKTTQLKKLLTSNELAFIMEAHNGLSAKIVEEAGFQGIWGSGLSISASLGVRDNNEASWTQVLDVAEYICDATKIPMLLDGDTGYGNFNNMRRLVTKLESRGVAGVCIEDKIFPKTNSFLREERQPLAQMDEFAGKIKAGLDARKDDDFCIVARIEAFISGWGLEEALKRAYCYHQAGASALLIHSKKSTAEEIFAFMKEWGNRCPVVIVPTKYYSTPTEQFRNNGISMVIWANHLLRSAISGMQETAHKIYTSQSLIDVEEKVAPLKEVFRLQNDQELMLAEKKYLPTDANTHAIVLAASRGGELGELTQDRPKAMLEAAGQSLFARLCDKFKNFGVENIITVRGYKKEAFPQYKGIYIDNDEFESTSELTSLDKACEFIKGDCYITYGDMLFRSFLLNLLQANKADVKIIVDTNLSNSKKKGDYVTVKDNNLLQVNFGTIQSIDEKKYPIHGEWIGLLASNEKGSFKIQQILRLMKKDASFNQFKMGDLLNKLIENDIKIGVEFVQGCWIDVDNINDFEKVQGF